MLVSASVIAAACSLRYKAIVNMALAGSLAHHLCNSLRGAGRKPSQLPLFARLAAT